MCDYLTLSDASPGFHWGSIPMLTTLYSMHRVVPDSSSAASVYTENAPMQKGSISFSL